MPDLTIIKTQLTSLEAQLEQQKAVLYRTDGAIQSLKWVIEQLTEKEPDGDST